MKDEIHENLYNKFYNNFEILYIIILNNDVINN